MSELRFVEVDPSTVATPAAGGKTIFVDDTTHSVSVKDEAGVVSVIGGSGLAVGGVLTGTLPNPGLAATAVTGAGYGNASQVATFTVGVDGRLTDAASVPIVITESQVTSLVSDLALKATLANPTFTGDPKAPTASPGDNDTSIATTAFVTAAVQAGVAGLSWKQEARAATTGAGTLATSFANGQTVDGVTLATGDRLLIKDQASGAENGIYVVAVAGAPTRSTDAATGAELVDAALYVSEGTTNADTAWTCTTNAPITPGVTALAFAQFGLGSTTDATISTSDITTNNVTSSKHGWAPKAPADATKYLNGAATPAYANVLDSDLSTSDITTNNASTSKHGFLKKLPNVATQFIDGTGTWRTLAELDVGASTNDAGNTSTALTIDWSLGTQQKCTATGNATITHTNMVAGKVYTLEYYTGAGSFTTSFASTNFAGGTAPTLTVAASKLDVFTFCKLASGTIVGSIYGQSFAP